MGEAQHPDPGALLRQRREGRAESEGLVVGMGADGEHLLGRGQNRARPDHL